MSFAATMNNGVSGMRAAQSALAVASQNIANANTPGYVRAEVNLAAQAIAGKGGGVLVDSITRAADKFLAGSYYAARGAESASASTASLLDRMQSLFGDPSSDTSTFAIIDQAYRGLAEAGADPASPVGRREAVAAMQSMFQELQRVGEGLESLRLEADTRISESVARLDDVLSQIHQLNTDVALARGSGGDSTGAENIRGSLVDQLSSLIDIRVTEKSDGRLEIRTQTGLALIGVDRMRLNYQPSSGAFSVPSQIEAVAISGEAYALEPHVRSGEVAGLLKARDNDIPDIAEALGVLADTMADEFNRLHSVQSSTPPPSEITGRATGLIGTDSHGFTGRSVIAALSERGEMQQRFTIDFDAGEILVETDPVGPHTTISFGATVDDLVNAIDTALSSASGDASFENGVLTMGVPAGSGLAFGEIEGDESNRASRGFAHFFGLNEVARRDMVSMFETGLRDSDAHGLVAGGELSFRIVDASGKVIAERSVAATGTTWADMRTALNASNTGMGPYGGVSLDSKGRMSITAAPGYRVQVTGDTTERGGPGGPPMSDVFGLAYGAMARRAMNIGVNPEILADSRRLAVASPDLSVEIGTRSIENGDGRGASRLSEVRNTTADFARAGQIGAHRATIGSFASRLGGEAGRLAVLSQRSADGAQAIAKVSLERRSEAESVSIDDEVIRMNAYQQAYAAAARMIQAANEMWQTLLAIR